MPMVKDAALVNHWMKSLLVLDEAMIYHFSATKLQQQHFLPFQFACKVYGVLKKQGSLISKNSNESH